MEKSNRVVVVGVGNLLLKDEGIGIHVVHALQKLDLPPGTEVIDGGTSPDLLGCLAPGQKLIIIDAVQAGGTPGAVYRFHPDDLALEGGGLISVHELSLMPSLKIMSLLGKEPRETVIIGVQPREVGWGTELSPELQDKIPQILRVVLEEIGRD